ncbi:MAG TPA: hypothetical protein VK569_07345 [Bacteroidota bacterium]|nr:hypothetical protein [Bacteroidota bacterium]
MIPRYDDQGEQLLPRLRAWRRHNIHIGLSPRTSPFWSGLLYREPRGDVGEYARLFDTALLRCDSGRPPDPARLFRMNANAGEGFAWTLLIDDEQMMYRFPYGHPDRNRRGEINPHFLDPRRIAETVMPIGRLLGSSVRIVMLKIGSVYRTEALDFDGFLRSLLRCLDALPPAYRYAVENGTSRFILPDYLACLRQRYIIHVPAPAPLLDAVRMPGALAGDTCVVHTACLAMEEEGEEWAAFRETVRFCLGEGKALYAYLTDGEETALPRAPRGTGVRRLTSLLAGLDPELARRSPIRRKAA